MSILHFLKDRKYKQSPVVPSLQIFDLLQWSRSEKEWKDECRMAITHYHQWKQSIPENMGSGLIMYSYIRGQLLRRHAEEVVRYYRLIRRNRKALFDHYMRTLPSVRT